MFPADAMSSQRWPALNVAIVLSLLGQLCGPAPVLGQQEADEYEAKTAFIYAFAKFVGWPAERADPVDSSFVIGAMGTLEVSESLGTLVGKRIHNRSIHIGKLEDPSHFEHCQVLLCSVDDLPSLFGEQPHLTHGVLTVGDDTGFAAAGGVLELTFVDGHLGFIVNRAAARRAGLELSASLFNLATRAIDDDGLDPQP
jgi:hypothetical protein